MKKNEIQTLVLLFGAGFLAGAMFENYSIRKRIFNTIPKLSNFEVKDPKTVFLTYDEVPAILSADMMLSNPFKWSAFVRAIK